MTITEVKQILKEMKEVVKYEDNKTEISVLNNSVDPYISNREQVRIETEINDIFIIATSKPKRNKENKENK